MIFFLLSLGLLSALQLAYAWHLFRQRGFNFLSFLLISQFVGYSLSYWAFLAVGEPMVLEGVAWYLILLFLATSALIACYHNFEKYFQLKKIAFILPENSPSFLFYIATLLLLSITLFLQTRFPERFLIPGHHIEFILMAIGLCYLPSLKIYPKILFFLALQIYSWAHFLETKMVGFQIFLTLFLLLLYLIKKRRSLLAKSLVSFSLLVLFQWTKGDYRNYLGRENHLLLTDRSVLFVKIVSHKILKTKPPERYPSSFVDEGLISTLSRLQDLSLHKVLGMTPKTVPFWEGHSYRTLWELCRSMLTGSGQNIWHQFGHRYQYLSPTDTQTEVIFSYFAEGYMNFGTYGILGEILVLSIALAFSEWMIQKWFHDISFLAFACLLFPFLPYQTDIGGAVFRATLSLFFLLLLKNKLFKRLFTTA